MYPLKLSFLLMLGVVLPSVLAAWPVQQPLQPCTAAPDAQVYQCLPQHPDVPPKGTGLALRLPVTNAGPVTLDIPGRGTKPLMQPTGVPPTCGLEALRPGILSTTTVMIAEDIGEAYALCVSQQACYCPQKNPNR